MKILICDKLDKLAVKNLQELGDCIDVSKEKNKEALIEENITDADILLIRSGTKITKELIDKANYLKIIARCGVGIDNIDIAEATKKNIFVTNTPNANIISAAELTIGLMIAAARNISIADKSLKNKEWSRSEFTGIELYGKQLGLVGFGKVARLVSERLQSFGMKIVFYDPFIESSTEVEQKLNLNELLETSDFVSLHVPKTDETKNLISKDKLSIMKSEAIIINASRGGVIDEDAVFELVNQNKLFSAGFDVYENEPPNLNKESINSKAITLPHLGASTKEAQERTGKEVIENIKQILSGDLTSVLNKK